MADALDDYAETRQKAQKFLHAVGMGHSAVTILMEARDILTPLVQQMNADPDFPQDVRDAAMARIVTLRQAAEDAIS